jgi:hypothetical protein
MQALEAGSAFSSKQAYLFCLNVCGLLALLSLRHFKGNSLSFLERLEPAHIDRGKVGEQIIASIIWRYETKSFCIVKPFNCTGCHDDYSLLNTGNPLLALLIEVNVSIAFESEFRKQLEMRRQIGSRRR